jgi:excisionase family DNA binding protein
MPMGKLLSINTISDILGISRSTVYQLIKRGELHRVHVRSRAFITSESLEAFQGSIRTKGGS